MVKWTVNKIVYFAIIANVSPPLLGLLQGWEGDINMNILQRQFTKLTKITKFDFWRADKYVRFCGDQVRSEDLAVNVKTKVVKFCTCMTCTRKQN